MKEKFTRRNLLKIIGIGVPATVIAPKIAADILEESVNKPYTPLPISQIPNDMTWIASGCWSNKPVQSYDDNYLADYYDEDERYD